MQPFLKTLLVPLVKPILAGIHRYKDAHRGETCYLFGDGISIKWFDLAAFSDKVSLSCGFIPFHNEFGRLSVPYFIVAEPWWFYPLERDPSTTGKPLPNPRQRAYRGIIEKYPDRQFFVNLSNYPMLSNKNITYTFRDLFDARLPANFISRRINAFHGSLRTSILMAAYMGFQRAYLVGFDYTHSPARGLHWYEKGQGIACPNAGYQEEFLKIASEFIDLTTITLDGGSEFIDAVTYEQHTGRKPAFRENTDLADDAYLKVLSTWSGYNIY